MIKAITKKKYETEVQIEGAADTCFAEYGVITMSMVEIMRQSKVSDDEIEKLLVKAIADGFSVLDQVEQARKANNNGQTE